MEEDKKNNKLIAEFMGGKWLEWVRVIQCQNDWSFLMDVVERIEEMGFTTSIKTSYVRINPREMPRYDNYISFIGFSENSWYSRKPCPFLDDDLDGLYEPCYEKINKRRATYEAVVAFINWYNKNK